MGWQNMAYLSLYRRWRPQVFSEVVGQEHIVRTLTNALDTGRVAHAYLFAGPRGTGKTTFARLLAKGLNCQDGPTGTPCNKCDSCSAITRGVAVDVLEIDGASNRGIDEIRELRDRVRYAPTGGRFKVYIIDEVHMLTNEAFNALLKVLEEPPSHVVFVFATTEAHKVPATILSRCQKFDFRRFSLGQLVGHLKQVAIAEKIEAEPQALSLIARHAEGSMRDALATMDQCLAAEPEKLTVATVTSVLGIVRREALVELVGYILTGDLSGAVQLTNALLDEGVEVKQLTRDLTAYTRDLVLLKAAPHVPELVMVDEAERETMRKQIDRSSLDQLLGVVEALVKVETELRWSTSPAMAMEIAMVRAVTGSQARTETAPHAADELSQLAKRITDLERLVRSLSSSPRSPAAESVVAEDATPKAEMKPTQAQPKEPEINVGQQSTSMDELGKLQSEWPSVLSLLKEERMISTEAFVREGVPGTIEGQRVVIYFSPRHRFHQANVEDARHKNAVERAISKVLGRPIQISTTVGDPPSTLTSTSDAGQGTVQSQTSGPASQETDVMQFPSVSKAVRYFGGKLTRVDPDEAPGED